MQETTGRVVQCVRGSCYAVCVWLGHSPESPEHDQLALPPIACAATQNSKQSTHDGVVDNALDGVIDVASASC